ncbi:hypothetical protein PR048_017588 [Dryococelus australis]|uniref:Uncharacterized protein n=1 Tax=Dryococelus australis TaxID=614101 RepID=A0ABQ9H9Y3_9NEOP|nr:hypothetical protein PR048_017588 [Dryococelus australis]
MITLVRVWPAAVSDATCDPPPAQRCAAECDKVTCRNLIHARSHLAGGGVGEERVSRGWTREASGRGSLNSNPSLRRPCWERGREFDEPRLPERGSHDSSGVRKRGFGRGARGVAASLRVPGSTLAPFLHDSSSFCRGPRHDLSVVGDGDLDTRHRCQHACQLGPWRSRLLRALTRHCTEVRWHNHSSPSSPQRMTAIGTPLKRHVDDGGPNATGLSGIAVLFEDVHAALREHYKSVQSPARSGDGALVARARVTLVAPGLLNQKRKKKKKRCRHAGPLSGNPTCKAVQGKAVHDKIPRKQKTRDACLCYLPSPSAQCSFKSSPQLRDAARCDAERCDVTSNQPIVIHIARDERQLATPALATSLTCRGGDIADDGGALNCTAVGLEHLTPRLQALCLVASRSSHQRGQVHNRAAIFSAFLLRGHCSLREVHAIRREHCVPLHRLANRGDGSLGGRGAVSPSLLLYFCASNARNSSRGHDDVAVRLLASHLGVTGCDSLRAVAPGFSASGSRAGLCRWSVGFFSGISRPPPFFHSDAVPYRPRFILIDSQDLDVKSRSNLFTHSFIAPTRKTCSVSPARCTLEVILLKPFTIKSAKFTVNGLCPHSSPIASAGLRPADVDSVKERDWRSDEDGGMGGGEEEPFG